MSTIDRQRTAAVQLLESIGWTFDGTTWLSPPRPRFPLLQEADAMLAVLDARFNALGPCTEGSPEEIELDAVATAIEDYEAARFTLRKHSRPDPA